ncbi:uncharacterized protein CIMG_11466 [Coccidioides immitis RS]|uniref:AB hydrolase-1 domain-containing protein n=1 Tax=Coccidioides immitis (strain RS) TaxID=246410 RepID=A0A0D8JXS8_COCIM|nr:uncharacterized protein CIMG_11466 [Coccidioides immitis RS]KJF61093.1 hypothetical protein CIMG_11466 [Coccidioides immitis RS]TPX21625.1 hypothetical protein DIZ76_015584 [Coccidioides immitis]
MPRFNSPVDGAHLFYRDYFPASHPPPYHPDPAYGTKPQPAIVFIHPWPQSGLVYEPLMLQLCETYRFRCIAPDRRGFGKSDWNGCDNDQSKPIDYSVFAADTIHLLEQINVGPFVFVAASMGPGETIQAYWQSEYVRENCKGFFWIGPALPCPLASSAHPKAPSQEVWDGIIQGLRTSRAEFVKQALPASLGPDGGHNLPQDTLQQYVQLILSADSLAVERCIQIITSTDFTEMLARIGKETDVPVMAVNGDKDTGNPTEATLDKIKDLIPRAITKEYQNGAHGLQITHRAELLEDLLEFVASLKFPA